MIRGRLLATVLLGFVFAVALPSPGAHARACHEETVVKYVQGLAEVSYVIICDGDRSGGTQEAGATDEDAVVPAGDVACYGLALQLGESYEQFCGGESSEPAEVTAPLVAQALRRLDLPASTLQVQPGNGRTLVNFDTNFFTDRDEFTRTVRLLGQRVDLTITPTSFTWHFGDGHTNTTNEPGAAYPALDITHAYRTTGQVTPSVDTTDTADYRVNNGPWQPVPGTVTIPGTTVDLEVIEASPLLVGYE